MKEDGALGTIEQLKRLVEMRGECDILCLVRSETGVELVGNSGDYVVNRGLIVVGEELLRDMHLSMNQALSKERERDSKIALAAMGAKGNEGMN